MNTIVLSLVIPTSREKIDSCVGKIIQEYPHLTGIEMIIVDEGTDFESFPGLQRPDCRVIRVSGLNRAQKLQEGFAASKGQVVIFHHPRSVIEAEGLQWVCNNANKITWGAFTHRFDQQSLGLKFTSFYSNKVRPWWSSIYYLDHCLVFRRDFLDRPIPPVPIFEDTEISKILRRHGAPQLLPFCSTTSSVRFQTNGFWRQALMNQKLKLDYFLGRSKDAMNKDYEKDLHLNGPHQ